MRKIEWESLANYSDIKFELYKGVAKITINRPEVYNAFRPETNIQMLEAMEVCRERNDIDVVIFTGAGDKVDQGWCGGAHSSIRSLLAQSAAAQRCSLLSEGCPQQEGG